MVNMNRKYTSKASRNLADQTDVRLLEFFSNTGFMADADETTYGREKVLKFIRAAYWHGVRDMAVDPYAIRQIDLDFCQVRARDAVRRP
jgi:hypothetical protein